MEKIRLKDCTEYTLHSTSSESEMVIILSEGVSATSVIGNFTESNLSQFAIVGIDGNEVAIYKDKEAVLPAPIDEIEGTYILTIPLKDVDITQKRIRLLEEENARNKEIINENNEIIDALVVAMLEV